MILFPVFWIVTMPLNFVIDSLVLVVAMYVFRIEHKKTIYKKSIIKVFFLGYFADIIMAGMVLFLGGNLSLSYPELDYLNYSPTSSFFSTVIMAACIALTGVLIYVFNKQVSFQRLDIEDKEKHKLALALAIFTAPYLFMVDLDIVYRVFGGW